MTCFFIVLNGFDQNLGAPEASGLPCPHQFCSKPALIKKHIQELNADVLGFSEFDCLNKTASFFSEEKNKIGQQASVQLHSFLTDQMGYEGFVHEKDNGLSASAIFYKKDKF